jgi:hypothetical protein
MLARCFERERASSQFSSTCCARRQDHSRVEDQFPFLPSTFGQPFCRFLAPRGFVWPIVDSFCKRDLWAGTLEAMCAMCAVFSSLPSSALVSASQEEDKGCFSFSPSANRGKHSAGPLVQSSHASSAMSRTSSSSDAENHFARRLVGSTGEGRSPAVKSNSTHRSHAVPPYPPLTAIQFVTSRRVIPNCRAKA